MGCCFLCGNTFGQANLGSAFVSNVTSNGSCVHSTTNGGGIQFWDIQAGGTYTVTLTGVTDCASQGQESTIGVIVHNSGGGNIYAVANYQDVGVYTFTITLTSQCLTMPIEYCTHDSLGNPANLPGTGKFAQDDVNGVAGGHTGHLRTATFGDSCSYVGDDTTCQGGGCQPGSIRAYKYFHFDPAATLGSPEASLAGWPLCLTPINSDGSFGAPQSGTTLADGSYTWNNLTPGEYLVSEADANDPNWFHNSDTSVIKVVHCGDPQITVLFGNYCTVPSGGLTLGFWSNKNGCKILTGSTTGTVLNPDVVTLLNGLCLRDANGAVHTFTSDYSKFRSWLLSATATNMAYMLSAQLATLELDVKYGNVDGGAFDISCSGMTINELMTAAKNSLSNCTATPCGGTCSVLSGNTQRPLMEMYKTCIDKINNNADVVPSNPSKCPSTTYTDACAQ